jgi:hypothetical protein
MFFIMNSIHRGFVPLEEIKPSHEEEHIKNVTKILQEYYEKWCLNKKKGFIIPQNNVSPDIKKTEDSYSKYGKYAGVVLMVSLFAYRLYNDNTMAIDDALTPKI